MDGEESFMERTEIDEVVVLGIAWFHMVRKTRYVC